MYLVLHDLPLTPAIADQIHMPTFMNDTFRLKVLLSILDKQIRGHPANELVMDVTTEEYDDQL